MKLKGVKVYIKLDSLPLFLMAAIVVITMPTTIITKTNKISQFAFQLNFILLNI